MTVTIDTRFIIDCDFYKEHIAKEYLLLWYLMHINTKSREHKRKHNLISKKDYEELLKENPKLKDEGILRGALYPVNEPEDIEQEKDKIVRNIRYAVHYQSETPNKVIILTTENEKKKYIASPHFKDIRGVSVKSDEDAIEIINSYGGRALGKDL